jgi:CheY-like chemotaxis protein
VVRSIEKLGFVAVPCCDGREALDTLNGLVDIQLVITDVYMPELDGPELVRQLRGSARFADLPVILISAAADNDLGGVLSLGNIRFVAKPVTVSSLNAVVNELVSPVRSPEQ